MGLPTLDRTGIEADWNKILAFEEQHIHEAYGLDSYAASSSPDQEATGDDHAAPRRHARPATGDVMMTSYFRILRDGPDAPMDVEDKPLSCLIQTANAEAFMKWCNLYRARFDIPATKRRSKPKDLRSWMLKHPDAMRHYFAFLPYPEYEAKTWELAELDMWGAAEAYTEQIGAIQRILEDATTTAQ
ncbi:hypothetical protein PR003_g32466, partial [Phytophthora rubi]